MPRSLAWKKGFEARTEEDGTVVLMRGKEWPESIAMGWYGEIVKSLQEDEEDLDD